MFILLRIFAYKTNESSWFCRFLFRAFWNNRIDICDFQKKKERNRSNGCSCCMYIRKSCTFSCFTAIIHHILTYNQKYTIAKSKLVYALNTRSAVGVRYIFCIKSNFSSLSSSFIKILMYSRVKQDQFITIKITIHFCWELRTIRVK